MKKTTPRWIAAFGLSIMLVVSSLVGAAHTHRSTRGTPLGSIFATGCHAGDAAHHSPVRPEPANDAPSQSSDDCAACHYLAQHAAPVAPPSELWIFEPGAEWIAIGAARFANWFVGSPRSRAPPAVV